MCSEIYNQLMIYFKKGGLTMKYLVSNKLQQQNIIFTLIQNINFDISMDWLSPQCSRK